MGGPRPMASNLKFALIGAGFIGRSHALAISAVNKVFADLELQALPNCIAEQDADLAAAAAGRFGFATHTTDWREAVQQCDAVIIAVPSYLHAQIAREACALGKHILCEKPVGLSAAEAASLARTSDQAGISNCVGFTYLRAPMVQQAKKLLQDGTFGAPLHFRGWHCEDYLASPDAPFSWRLDASLAGNCGALGDLGWHILSIARYLCGNLTGLTAQTRLFFDKRPAGAAGHDMRHVENEDWAGITAEFASGAVGQIEVSRVAHGRKMDIGFELVCERGTLALSGERLNELQIYRPSSDDATAGFQTIQINADHPDYGHFIPAPGHGLGFNDLKTIELKMFLQAISAGNNADPDLADAARIARICEAALHASAQRLWVDDPEAFHFNPGGA